MAQYYEAAYQYRVYVDQGKDTQADKAHERMEEAASRMGELAPVRDRIDRILQ
ncbi:unknown [Roseburia sp. CAG:100]|nr:unknown [Roseburia sp. CAG:100]